MRDQPVPDVTGESESLEQQAVALAASIARSVALMDAEKTIRDMAAEPRRWSSDARLLKVAADRIARLK